MKKLLVFLILFISCSIIKADKWDELALEFPGKYNEIYVLKVAVEHGLSADAEECHKLFSKDVVELLQDIPNNRFKFICILNECQRMINIANYKNDMKKSN